MTITAAEARLRTDLNVAHQRSRAGLGKVEEEEGAPEPGLEPGEMEDVGVAVEPTREGPAASFVFHTAARSQGRNAGAIGIESSTPMTDALRSAARRGYSEGVSIQASQADWTLLQSRITDVQAQVGRVSDRIDGLTQALHGLAQLIRDGSLR